MKKFLVLALLSSGIALADDFSAAPLKNHPVCISTNPVTLSTTNDDVAVPASFKADMASFMTNRLKAYRIPNESLCGIRPKSVGIIYASVTLAGPIGGSYRAYNVKLEEFTGAYTEGGAVTLWQDYIVGVSSYTPDVLADKLKSALSDLIDRFAADYALARP